MSAPCIRVIVSVPGGIGNLGPGLDVLGCALTGARDEVIAKWSQIAGITIIDAGHPQLPTDPAKNTASIAAAAVMRAAITRGVRVSHPGIAITIKKGLPLSGGQGGSAASAVAGAVAANALIWPVGSGLTQNELLTCALEGEEAVAGRHLDNIAPSLLGGIVLVRSLDPIEVVKIPAPAGLRIVLATPAQQLTTTRARSVLPIEVPRSIVVHQLAQVAAIISACHSGDLALLGRSMDDRIAEPARTPLLPGFADAKISAIDAGALGVSISGAGPTAFALCDCEATACKIAQAMQSAYARAGLDCTVRICEIDTQGAIVKDA
ncbi:MAG: homoserine kinase [Planctomycetes bacterium]|nr:homoserine kinase [Planctomycetota bacterium]